MAGVLLFLDAGEVRKHLAPADCVHVMAGILTAFAQGRVHQPLRTFMRPPDARGAMGLMPCSLAGEPGYFALKAVCVFAGNPAQGMDAHQGSVLLSSGATGELLAVMDASAITAIRTGAVSALATRLLAREDAGDLALVGAGVQARTHLAAIASVRKLRRVRVACRNIERARAFVKELTPSYDFPIEALEHVEDAVRDADLIVTATNAKEPIVRRDWISAGAHLNVIGSFVPTAREVDSATMAAATLVVDRRESVLAEAGDYVLAASEGLIGPSHVHAELGELLTSSKPGRTSPTEITLFKSVGMAAEDLGAAIHLYEAAKRAGFGRWIERAE